jgi:hypothetical protein
MERKQMSRRHRKSGQWRKKVILEGAPPFLCGMNNPFSSEDLDVL